MWIIIPNLHVDALCVCILYLHTYSGGVLLLLVQPGAASLLAVAVLLQRVKHLIGQLQVHPQTISHMDLWSKLKKEEKTM